MEEFFAADFLGTLPASKRAHWAYKLEDSPNQTSVAWRLSFGKIHGTRLPIGRVPRDHFRL